MVYRVVLRDYCQTKICKSSCGAVLPTSPTPGYQMNVHPMPVGASPGTTSNLRSLSAALWISSFGFTSSL